MSYVNGFGQTFRPSTDAMDAAKERAKAAAIERAKAAAIAQAKAAAIERARMKVPGSAAPELSLGGPPWGLIALGAAGIGVVGLLLLKRRKKS